jgi:2-polyprenyl-3-methyl-5-hydroxy-6-metoxy-1,4-benzoquinol methylase
MPVVPNFLERLVLLQLNQGPGLLLDFLGAQAFRTALAGLHLGVFDALAEGPKSPAALSKRIGADERGTTLLLEALDTLGYVKRSNGHFANTAMTTKWLPLFSQGANFFETVVLEEWDGLEDAIRCGKPSPREWRDPQQLRDFQGGMIAMARGTATEAASRVKLPSNARRLVDVGGGHGLYSIAFCRRNPQLTATVFDVRDTVELTREVIDQEGMTERVSTRTGDFWRDDLGGGYDVALLFNILHANQAPQNVELLAKVAAALNPGGTVVVMDQIAGSAASPTAKAVARLQALNMYLSAGGQTYSFDEIAGWLSQGGLGAIKRITMRRAPGMGLVVGRAA